MSGLTIGSLFSGIGGLELGLERAGLGHVVWQVERDEFCRRVLARHWPDARRFDDVRSVGALELGRVDVICGGFPCQDLSVAGKRRGLTGDRSGLWTEYARIICELAPRAVVIENVQHTWREWVPFVRRDLHGLGYASVPLRLSAADVGAWHRRRRVFVFAHPDGQLLRELSRRWSGESRASTAELERPRRWPGPPELTRGDDGVPCAVERRRALGNAVVPQCAEVVGRAIVEAMKEAA